MSIDIREQDVGYWRPGKSNLISPHACKIGRMRDALYVDEEPAPWIDSDQIRGERGVQPRPLCLSSPCAPTLFFGIRPLLICQHFRAFANHFIPLRFIWRLGRIP